MTPVLFAFLFPSLSWKQAAVCPILLFLLITTILPWMDVDMNPVPAVAGETAPYSHAEGRTAVVSYPLVVLALIILYRHHLHVAAATWAIMAVGDGIATVAGQWVHGKVLPWNSRKTYAGSLSFIVAGTAAAYILTCWIAPEISAYKALTVCAAASVVGALIESLPLRLNDNITVPLVTSTFFFCISMVERSALDSNLPYLGRRILLAVAVNLVFAVAGFALKAASCSGAVCGFLLGTTIYLGYGYKSFLLLFTFILLGSVSTRAGLSQKAARGLAEKRHGARSWREGLANLLTAAFFAGLVITTHHEAAFLIALVAVLAEAAGDTVSSEVGQWVSDRAYLITTLKPVAAGVNGGISLAGTVAGLMAVLAMTGLGIALGLCGPYRFAGPLIVLGASFAGNLLDSLLGATMESRGLITNEIVNFAGTSFAGALALGLALHLGL